MHFIGTSRFGASLIQPFFAADDQDGRCRRVKLKLLILCQNREIKTLRMLLFVVRVVVFGIFAVLTGKVVVDDCTVVMLRFCKVLM